MASVYGEMCFGEEEAEGKAHQLKDAMDGCGTNEEAIVEVLVNCNNPQRQEIKNAYEVAFGKPLVDDILSELSGDLEDVIVGMLLPPREYDATMIHDAMSGAGTDEKTLIGVLCTRTNDEIEEIKECYKNKYDKELSEDLNEDCGGYFARLMHSLSVGERQEGDGDDDTAAEDAQKLIDAGVAQLGTDECDFNSVLALNSYRQIRRICRKYQEMTGQDLLEAIDSEMGGALKEGFEAIVKCAQDKKRYFAERLNKAMRGWGTDDKELIRLIVSRSETDLGWVKGKYQEMYDVPLYDDVEGECSGYYKKCLLSIINGGYIG